MNPWERNAGKYDRPSSSPISGNAVRARPSPTMPADQAPKALPPGASEWGEERVVVIVDARTERRDTPPRPVKDKPIGKRIRRKAP